MAFPTGWWSFELSRGVRPGTGTYDLYPADALPPLDAALAYDPKTPYAWLVDDEDQAPKHDKPTRGLAGLIERAGALGVALPEPFVRFFSDRSLGLAVPSCTACEWDLATQPVPSPVQPGAWIIRFYRDQQDCLLWYLYVDGDRASVICSPIPFGDADEPADVVLANTWEVAPDFPTFVARWWLENRLWDKLEGRPMLNPIEQAYVDHCRSQTWLSFEE